MWSVRWENCSKLKRVIIPLQTHIRAAQSAAYNNFFRIDLQISRLVFILSYLASKFEIKSRFLIHCKNNVKIKKFKDYWFLKKQKYL